jgi:ribosomal RNA-processing protein 7
MPSTSSSSSPLIKGYLPVRLRLPTVITSQRRLDDGDGDDDDRTGSHPSDGVDHTYFFVREHQGKATPAVSSGPSSGTDATSKSSATTTTATKSGTTLFVANAPVVPGISTKILLKSIFGRFADVTRVTVVETPRGGGAVGDGASLVGGGTDAATRDLTSSSSSSSTGLSFDKDDSYFYPSCLPHSFSEGKFAHVVFASAKELKRAKRALEDAMAGRTNRASEGGRTNRRTGYDGDGDSAGLPPALSLDRIEIQSLSDESLRRWEEERRRVVPGYNQAGDDGDSDDDQFGLSDSTSKRTKRHHSSGLMAVAHRYQQSCRVLTRDRLLQECNAVMESYEVAELARRQAQEVARSQPDDDGFVTVTYSGGGAVGTKSEMEESLTATTPSRRKGNKRTRKKKEAAGSAELTDFYRFQRKENRKRTMDDLRRQFDDDLKRVRRLKEEKQYRPF